MSEYKKDKTEYELVHLLLEKKMTVATCESCTGGLISKRITNVPGASSVFGYGVCTYANEAKIKLLSVREQTLIKHGAVSEQTALEMAKGMISLSNADIAISTTGIAGPGGGSLEKPVGLVYTAYYTKDGKCGCKKLLLGDIDDPCRENIRYAASDEAMKFAIEYIRRL
ncbi:MAG: nicotinamide-nucleotide amidohydrolase family protein [Ruminococcaceae bacterium]|nr:nicotinamide-nucleotide amidohydrolase family protein [Oscillospiraceae bacterium]